MSIGILWLVILIAYAVLMLRLAINWSRIPVIPNANSNLPKVSLVIAFRNEAQNLPSLCHAIKAIQYPKELFEIIWVDDHSEDDGILLVQEFKEDCEFEVEVLKSSETGKKKALRRGIEKAKGDLVVCTDADCLFGKNWIQMHANAYLNGAKFVSGPVVFEEESSFFEHLVQLEFTGLIASGAASIRMKLNLMANGANLSFDRRSFWEIDSHTKGKDRATGDDVYLLESFGKHFPKSIQFIKDPEAIVSTKYEPTIQGFIQQRLRWASKGADYLKPRAKLAAILIFMANLSLLISPLFLFFDYAGLLVFSILWLIKLITDGLFYLIILGFFGKRNLLPYVLPAQLFHVPYVVVTALLGSFVKYHWKGRKTR